MKYLTNILLVLVFCMLYPMVEVNAQSESNPEIWVSAYIASWSYNVGGHGNWGNIRRDELDWNSFTHGIFFAQSISGSTCEPSEPGAWENVSPDRLSAFVKDANANDVPAIMSFGGAGNEAFASCVETEPETVANGIADFVLEWGFDGADIDPEPVPDEQSFVLFMERLRERLPDAIITGAALSGSAEEFAAVEEHFNQINIMSYDLSGAWEGWYSWHNSPIYNPSGGTEEINIPGSNTEYPNIEQLLNRFVNAGVPIEKLGFGIDLYGYVWTGVNAPQQDAEGASRRFGETSYDNLVDDFPGIATDPEWDEDAQASWYSTDNQFVSFDNQQTIKAKFEYAKEKGVGGMIVWEYSGSPEVLVPVIRQELFGDLPPTPASPELTFPANGATGVETFTILEWDTAQHAVTYEIQVSRSSNFNELIMEETGLDTTTIEISGLDHNNTYIWRVRSKNEGGNSNWSDSYSFRTAEIGTSINAPGEQPTSYNLEQNYPNPFNPTTNISFSLPKTSQVSLKIYNLLGSEVATLIEKRMPAGNFEAQWDASNHPSGVYIYRIIAGDYSQTKKLTLIK